MDCARTLLVGLTLITTLAGLTGCETDQLKQQRDLLWSENKELRENQARLQTALDAAEADRNRLQTQNSQLQDNLATAAQPAPLPAPAPLPLAASANSGFSSIDGVETIQGAGQVTVRVPGDVLFSPGKIALKPTARKTLDKIAAVLKREHSGETVRIEGYTDNDPIKKSPWADNLELSLQRAAAVHRYLEQQGVDGKRMYAAGFGPHKPRGNKNQSRRVEIVVLAK
jgi:chemotaxis protein MotB